MKHSFLTLLCAAQFSLFNFQCPVVQAQDRGFIHPSGLHTQADFDRVKAQIADGNATVKAAYQKLTSAAYAQSSVQTYPVETIVRGGGSGENYINACRGATMAYQNALRWKIGGTKANAEAAVRILMAWANTTKAIGGDSNYALAAGLYGYQFAQAAELMRDYEGWSREDFASFQRWMLDVWYPSSIGFLRGRNGTWENSGKWWQAPGHYWSNWGLCNALCVCMIGILCDDVFMYNQGMSYFKYDQCGTFTEVRTEVPIKNDGLTEFLGNLVVTTYGSDLETGSYGLLGQMNESGRDTGHSAMALGLAVDLAKVGWNQGDDLFAYMNHRLAAGIEYVAAQTQSVTGLPWVNYQYGQSGYYYTDSRAYVMTEPALGAQMRPYWGTVIGVYEGVKGVRMPFSEVSYQNMGIDEGGQGSTSGGYDHLGYSVLMNTRDEQLCPADHVPTELTPKMEYSGTLNTNLIPSLTQERSRGLVSGKVISHNELGGLVNTFTTNNNTTVPTGQTLTLLPQLPDGEEDTGLWQWNTGETTRDITVQTDKSHIYRVTYTNARGIESQLSFAIAVKGDCTPDPPGTRCPPRCSRLAPFSLSGPPLLPDFWPPFPPRPARRTPLPPEGAFSVRDYGNCLHFRAIFPCSRTRFSPPNSPFFRNLALVFRNLAPPASPARPTMHARRRRDSHKVRDYGECEPRSARVRGTTRHDGFLRRRGILGSAGFRNFVRDYGEKLAFLRLFPCAESPAGPREFCQCLAKQGRICQTLANRHPGGGYGARSGFFDFSKSSEYTTKRARGRHSTRCSSRQKVMTSASMMLRPWRTCGGPPTKTIFPVTRSYVATSPLAFLSPWVMNTFPSALMVLILSSSPKTTVSRSLFNCMRGSLTTTDPSKIANFLR